MKKTILTKAAIISLAYTLFAMQASAFSLSSGGDQTPFFEKFVSSLFQNTGKSGAALIGEVTSIDISTTTSILTLSSKQKLYTIGLSPETKVRKFGIPGDIEDIKTGDKVSIVSSLSKTETPKLRAKVISILSQAGEDKYKVATTTDGIATSTEATSTAPLPIEKEKVEKEEAPQKEMREVKDKERKEVTQMRVR